MKKRFKGRSIINVNNEVSSSQKIVVQETHRTSKTSGIKFLQKYLHFCHKEIDANISVDDYVVFKL